MLRLIEEKSLYLFVICINKASMREGQGALEYIAIALGLVALAGIGFQALGINFLAGARKAICQEFANTARATCT